jgi:hypothetical protein
VDDILAIAVLSVVTTMVQTGDTSPQIIDVIFLILQILGLCSSFNWLNSFDTTITSCRKAMEVER